MSKMFYIKNQVGLSLIEMMVVVVISGLIILGLVTFFTGGIKSWVTGQSQLEAQREARQAMDQMVREIRKGKNIILGSDTTISVAIPEFRTDSGTIAAYNVTYDWSGNTWDPINRIVSSGTNILINNVQKLHFTYPDTSIVHIVLEIDVDRDSSPDITLNSNVNLRNFGL